MASNVPPASPREGSLASSPSVTISEDNTDGWAATDIMWVGTEAETRVWVVWNRVVAGSCCWGSLPPWPDTSLDSAGE